jgi:hypothetical protein
MGRLLGCANCSWNWRDNDIDVHLYKFGDETWYTIKFALGTAKLDYDIFLVNVSQLAESLP